MQRAGLGLMVRPETSRVSRCSNSGPVFLGSRGFSFRQGADREGAPTAGDSNRRPGLAATRRVWRVKTETTLAKPGAPSR